MTCSQTWRIASSTINTAKTGAPLRPAPESHRRIGKQRKRLAGLDHARADSISTILTLVASAAQAPVLKASTSSRKYLVAISDEVALRAAVAAAMLKLSWSCRWKRRIAVDAARCKCRWGSRVRRVAAWELTMGRPAQLAAAR